MIHAQKVVVVPISTLVPDPANARKHDEKNVTAIANSLQLFGQRKAIVVQKKGMVVRAGNGTLQAAKQLGWKEIAAVVIDDDNTTAAQYAIADNRSAELADWDMDALGSLLTEWDDEVQQQLGFDKGDLEQLMQDSEQAAAELTDNYSRKVQAPIYEPKGTQPKVAELFDRSATERLQQEIAAHQLPPDVKEFLLAAAQRHTQFHFARIAEFYCHAEPETQRLMEASALVVIDFNEAVARGFVQLTERLRNLAEQEATNDDA
jgi:ParB-like chromosome segregation protein Spo0J